MADFIGTISECVALTYETLNQWFKIDQQAMTDESVMIVEICISTSWSRLGIIIRNRKLKKLKGLRFLYCFNISC
jgi:hypothetical protein